MKLAVDAATGARRADRLDARPARQALLRPRPRSPTPSASTALALQVFPGYAYGARRARAGARARAAPTARRSRPSGRRSTRSRCRSTSPRSATSTGVTGRPALARRQYALIGAIERLLHANGVKHRPRDRALPGRPRDRAPARARARPRRPAPSGPSIDGDDVLAWALARNGRCAEALPYSRRALRLGTQDALKFFHRGMIERCLGHARGARVVPARARAEPALLAALGARRRSGGAA